MDQWGLVVTKNVYFSLLTHTNQLLLVTLCHTPAGIGSSEVGQDRTGRTTDDGRRTTTTTTTTTNDKRDDNDDDDDARGRAHVPRMVLFYKDCASGTRAEVVE